MIREDAGKRKTIRIQNDVTDAPFAVPSTIRVVAAATRRRRSATPALPAGNMENSLCIAPRLAAPPAPNNPQEKGSESILLDIGSSLLWHKIRRRMPVPATPLQLVRKPLVRPLVLLFAYRLIALLLPALLCVPCFGLNPNRNISQYAHTSWRIQEGFFNGRATRVAQTTDGYLWFGTHNGLMRFDGVRFMPWTPPLGSRLPEGDIRA